jgi:hypothetical protein
MLAFPFSSNMLAFSFAIAQEVWHFSQMAQRLPFLG